MNLPPTLRKLAGGGVTFSRALLKDGNLLSRPQPEAVLAPVSYRSSRRHRQRKRLLVKVPIVFCITLGTSSVFGALTFFTMIVKTVVAVKSTMAIWTDQSGTDIMIVVGTGFSIAGLASSSFARVILGIVHIKSFFKKRAPIRMVYKGWKQGATIVVGV